MRYLLVVFVCFVSSCSGQSLQLEKPEEWKDIDPDQQPRWVVAYPEGYGSALVGLKKKRVADGYAVVELSDPSREKIQQKVADLKLGSHTGDCLFLIGDVPSALGLHHRMKGKASDSRYALTPKTSTPLFPVGRLPSRSVEETARMVKRLLAYESMAQDRPKSLFILTGNPARTGRIAAADFMVSQLSRSLLKRVHDDWAVTGVADVKGHSHEVSEELYPKRFVETLMGDYTAGGYFGHSGADIFGYTSKGVFFKANDWDKLKSSSNKGLLVSCGCFGLETPEAYGYQAVRSAGGPVAFIGATGESYAIIGVLAANGLTDAMASPEPFERLGEWWTAVQHGIATESVNGLMFKAFDMMDGSKGKLSLIEQRHEHLEMWMLLGDPAMRLFSPNDPAE